MYEALIVDDERMIREDLKDFVNWQDYGFSKVRLARHGVEAMEITEGAFPDLILADINMPKMNGLELIRGLREQGFEGHFIVITAHGEFEYARQAISFGVKEYILKPIDFAKLNQIVRLISEELKEERGKGKDTQFALISKGLIRDILQAADSLRREDAQQAIETLFEKCLTLEQPLEALVILLQNTIVQAETMLNDRNPSYYASQQSVFLDLMTRLKECGTFAETRNLFDQLAAYISDFIETLDSSEGKGEFSHFKRLIKEHLSEDISLEWLSQRVHMSANYLSVAFKKETGENFNDYLTREKMLFARSLLLQRDKKINKVGALIGYANYRSFSRAFKNYFGCSPSDFRDKYSGH
ncbi:response regulator [Cohnella abietis]|uniref:Putative transcriptional regulatory protein YesN n=1 Tax=Cohnella abietis TaxID=2507935 RepID=A0A3T1CZA8_9BACL|nr:response regulator [Cohnella abietis]BBI31180.1 putative transcriptional regulatory protein YesN [Cohnella abietis]